MSLTSSPASLQEYFPGEGEMAVLMRAYEWSKTPLGHPGAWPQSLRTVVRIMLGSRFAMWMAWGPELTFFCNDAYSPTLGIKHPWALGKPANEVWSEIWADIGPLIHSVLETGVATWDEALLLFLERSGFPEETYHTFSYSPAADDSGATAGMLCVVSEETERVIGDRRLAFLRDLGTGLAGTNTEEELFEVVKQTVRARLQDLPYFLTYLFDPGGKTARLALSEGVPKGAKAAPERIDPQSCECVWPAEQMLRGGKTLVTDALPDHLEEIPIGPWFTPSREVAIVPIGQGGQDSNAGFFVAAVNPYRRLDPAYIGFFELMSGQIASALANVRAYDAERRRAEELAKLDQAKTAFFSNVSHELRTPLTLMLGTLEDTLSRADELEDRDRENLLVAERNSLRLLKLVNTLLEFSRIEAGRVQASFEPVDLAAFTADLASNFRSASERAGLRLIVDCEAISEPVYVDRDMWEKIVLNLISNALKHTFEGEIEIAVTRDGADACLSVRDTGSGISPEAQARLFERFYRVEGVVSRSYEGTGIGLALVRELVTLHGGHVGVDSEVGKGSRFSVSVPLGCGHLPSERVALVGRGETTSKHARSFVEEALGGAERRKRHYGRTFYRRGRQSR